MRIEVARWGWALIITIGNWHIGFYLNPRHWWFDWHTKSKCCKWWLLIWFLDINRAWTDEEYDKEFPTDEAA